MTIAFGRGWSGLPGSAARIAHGRPKPSATTPGAGWTEAGDLAIGDPIASLAGGSGRVESVWTRSASAIMLDLTVPDVHSFFVGEGGWWVHNISCAPPASQQRLDHIFKNAGHRWSRTGLDRSENPALIGRVSDNPANVVDTVNVLSGRLHTFEEAVGANTIVVTVFENRDGVMSVSHAWVRSH